MCGCAMVSTDKRYDLESFWAPGHDVGATMQGQNIVFSGVFRCKSRHGCFHCGKKISQDTSRELSAMVGKFLQDHPKGSILFLTATVPHKRRTPLAASLDVVLSAWRRLRQGRLAGQLKSAGLVGYARALDITYGGHNGWHPHIHAILLLDRPVTDSAIESLRSQMHGRWNTYVQKQGFRPVNYARFQLERMRSRSALAKYVGSVSGTERWSSIARQLDVGGKKGWKGKSPSALYVQAANGCAESLRLVHEFEAVANRRKFLTYSKLVREIVKTLPAVTDDETEQNPRAINLPVWLYRRLRQKAGAIDLLEAAMAIGQEAGLMKDYAGREVQAYEPGSPGHTAHVFLLVTYQKAGNRVPPGPDAVTDDFLAVLASELIFYTSPRDWWGGTEWTSTP